jgi:steroid delta-isomerase-like uncharacterized protein
LFNKDGYRQLIGEIASVYPDYNLVIEDLIADGDKVTVRFSESGTMKGDFMGVLATGKSFMTPAIEIWRFENGRIKEMWMARDLLTTMTQTGVIPPME